MSIQDQFPVSDGTVDMLRGSETQATSSMQLLIGRAEEGIQTVASIGPVTTRYPFEVIFDNAFALWRFEEADDSGPAIDTIFDTNLTGAYNTGATPGVPGLVFAPPDTSVAVALTALDAFTAETFMFPHGIEFWVRTTAVGPADILTFETLPGAVTDGDLIVRLNADGSLSALVRDGAAVLQRDADTAPVNDDAWHHVIINDDGAVLNVIVDLTAALSSSGTGTVVPDGTTQVRAGAAGVTFTLDELALYDSPLSNENYSGHYGAAGPQ